MQTVVPELLADDAGADCLPDLSLIVNWSDGKRVMTKEGHQLIVHEAEPNEEFWALWRRAKPALRREGISVNRHYETGAWILHWWKPLPKEEQARLNQNIVASQQADASIVIPKPDNGKDYFPYQRAGIAFALRILEG